MLRKFQFLIIYFYAMRINYCLHDLIPLSKAFYSTILSIPYDFTNNKAYFEESTDNFLIFNIILIVTY